MKLHTKRSAFREDYNGRPATLLTLRLCLAWLIPWLVLPHSPRDPSHACCINYNAIDSLLGPNHKYRDQGAGRDLA